MLSPCCLCGGKLSDDSPSVLDPSMFGSSFYTTFQQIIEENEKEALCMLDSGNICHNCVAVLESVEICLNKLRDLKEGIVKSYLAYLAVQHNRPDEHQYHHNNVHHRRRGFEHVQVKEEEFQPQEMPISNTEPSNTNDFLQKLEQPDLLDKDAELEALQGYESSDSVSPEPETVQVFDLVLEDRLEGEEMMQILKKQIEVETWNNIFSKNSEKEEGEIQLAENTWKSTLLSTIRPHIALCDLDLLSVMRTSVTSGYPMFMGYCKHANCGRSIQIRILEERKIEVQYSVGDCSMIVDMDGEGNSSRRRLQDIDEGGSSSSPGPDMPPPPGTAATMSVKVCEFCLKQFHSTDPSTEKEAMKNHLRVCHSQSQDQIYTCKCGRRFNKKGARNSHLKRCERVTDTEAPILNCDNCSQAFLGIARLQRHAKTCKPPVQCQVCKKEVLPGVTLEKHMITAHGVFSSDQRRKYSCDKCDKIFWKKYNLESHSLMHSDLKPFSCHVEGCNKKFKRELTLRQHVSTRHENKTVTLFCALCTAQFKSSNGLKLHMDSVHNLGPGRARKFECDSCDKKFRCKSDLNTHAVTHSKEKNYQCELCDVKFSRSGSLKDHMNIHRQLFMCQFCNKCFGRDRYLQGHVKICPMAPQNTCQPSSQQQDSVSAHSQGVANTQSPKKSSPLLCQIVEESAVVHKDNGEQLIECHDQLIQVSGESGEEDQITASPRMLLKDNTASSSNTIIIENVRSSASPVEENEELVDADLDSFDIDDDEVDKVLGSVNNKKRLTPDQIVIISPSLKRLEKARRMHMMHKVQPNKILNLSIANTNL